MKDKYPTLYVSSSCFSQNSSLLEQMGGINNQHPVLYFTLFWVFTSSDYDSSMKDKYPTLYVSSSYFFTTFHFKDTNE